MNQTPLLIIDMLNDFFQQDNHLAVCRSDLVRAINMLAAQFRSHGQQVIWVRQEFAPDLHDAFLEMRRRNLHVTLAGTNGCEILPDLDRHPDDIVLTKKRYSAFFGTRLEDILKGIDARTLVIGGINTHACVRTSVIDAYQRDYDVVVATDCTASYDMTHHDVTLRYFNGKIARCMSNAQIVATLSDSLL